jgi:stress-induced morphogen
MAILAQLESRPPQDLTTVPAQPAAASKLAAKPKSAFVSESVAPPQPGAKGSKLATLTPAEVARIQARRARRKEGRARRTESATAASPPATSAQSVAAAASGVRSFSTCSYSVASSPFRALRSSLSSPLSFRSFSSTAAPPRTTEATIEQLLRNELKASVLRVEDTSGGCGAFFQVLVVSPAFTGLSLVKQHRLVNATLKPHIANLHGLTLQTMTEAQWQQQQQAQQAQQAPPRT